MNVKACFVVIMTAFALSMFGCANRSAVAPIESIEPIIQLPHPVEALPTIPAEEPVKETPTKASPVEAHDIPEPYPVLQEPVFPSKVISESASKPSSARPKVSPASKYSTKKIDRIVDGFDQGSFAFKAPLSMDIKDPPATVMLQISKKMSEEEIRKSIRAKGTEQAESGRLEIANNVEATLKSSDFEVVLLSKNPQLVSSGKTFTWEWTIKPKKVNKTIVGKLHLNVSTTLDEGSYVLHSLDRELNVTISKADQGVDVVKDNWEYLKWAWTAILVPVFGFIWKKYNKNEDVKPNDGNS